MAGASPQQTDRKTQDAYGYLLAGSLLVAFITYSVPALGIGVLLGGLSGALAPVRPANASKRQRIPSSVRVPIVFGLAVSASTALLRSHPAISAQARRFDRKWGFGSTDFEAFLLHPWAWFPLTVGVAAIVGGCVFWWRSR